MNRIALHTLALSAALVFGCSSSTSSVEPTAIRIHAAIDTGMDLTQLELTGEGHDTKYPSAPQKLGASEIVTILLADSEAGKSLQVDVWGLANDKRVAHGDVTAKPVLHQTVDAEVTLTPWPCTSGNCMPPSCMDECTESTCAGLVFQECAVDSDGCKRLKPIVSCETDACSVGACDPQMGCTSTPVTCDTPPLPTCSTNNEVLTYYNPQGTCSNGKCEYQKEEKTKCSSFGCDFCDLCAILNCPARPAPACTDASTLRTYEDPYCWDTGTCSYDHHDIVCAKGCSNGACIAEGKTTSIAVDYESACAVQGGSVKCWGSNESGELGDGTKKGVAYPVTVSGLSTATEVTNGFEYACALTSGGAVYCWGQNGAGVLGDGNMVASKVPVQVTGLSSGVESVAAGNDHTCALLTGGSVVCWGDNSRGQLGDGALETQSSVPVTVSGLSGVLAIAAGGSYSCAITSSHGLQCWGTIPGFSGDPDIVTESDVPTDIAGMSSGVEFTSVGDMTACAVQSGAAYCWGDNSQRELGDGTKKNSVVPVAVSGLGANVASVSTNSNGSCAVLTSGGVKCWGDNPGDGTGTQSTTPVDVVGLTNVLQISVGDYSTCARTSAFEAWCWGDDFYGELGNNSLSTSLTPTRVIGL